MNSINPEQFAQYMKTKEAFFQIYAASFNPTDKASVSLTFEECKLLLSLFDQNEIQGFLA